MDGLSINDILNKIDARLDDLRLTDDTAPIVSLDPLSEVGLYITSDRLLADLYRQYLEAQRNYINSIQDHGKDSPMTEIASDMSESAFCAMETRLIELREEEGMAERVLRLQEKQRSEYIETMKKNQAEYARRGIKQPIAINPEKEESINDNTMTSGDQNINMQFWAVFALSFLQQEQQMQENYKPAVLEFARVAA